MKKLLASLVLGLGLLTGGVGRPRAGAGGNCRGPGSRRIRRGARCCSRSSSCRRRAAAAAAPAASARRAAPAPVPNKGDTAWMTVATALVILMTIPGLALFYGGLVRSKNMLSVLMQVFVVTALIYVLWALYGYSVAFTAGNPFMGAFDKIFLKGITPDSIAATFSKGVVIPELTFVGFQATFAAITCALIVGAFAERIKFSAVLLFMVLWFTFSYLPIAHMVWYWDGPDAITDAKLRWTTVTAAAGWLWAKGALDFAGGTVVHINAGIAGLVGAYVVGKRIGYGKESLTPHSLTLTMVGASLLWVGWFGFNAGSNLEANGIAALAFVNTLVATAAATLAWIAGEALVQGQGLDAGRRFRRRRRPGGHHAGLRLRRPDGRDRDRPAGRPDLPVGRQRPEAHAGRRRLAGRVRRPRRRRYPGRPADRRVRLALAGRRRASTTTWPTRSTPTTRSAARSGSSSRPC